MTVLVVVEHDRGKIALASLEAMTAARTIDADVAAITLGAEADGLATELAAFNQKTPNRLAFKHAHHLKHADSP